MGRVAYSSIMVIFLVCSSSIGGLEAMSWWNMPFKPTWFDIHFGYKEPFPGVAKSAIACGRLLSPDCSDQIYNHIFRFTGVSDGCCKSMVEMGEICNTRIIIAFSAIGRFKKYAFRIRTSSLALFSECTRRGH